MATVGGVITTGAHPKALWPGVKTWWGREYDQHQQEYQSLFDVETSDKAYEEDVEISGFGVLREKDQGAALTYDSEVQGAVTRYTHIAYAGGYIVTYEELRDNLYEVVSKRRAAMLAFAGRQTEEIVAANIFNQAFSSSFPIGDGQAFISTTHPTLAGNQSNQLTTSADLSELAIEDMGVQIMQAQDYRGNKIALVPQCLVIPPYRTTQVLQQIVCYKNSLPIHPYQNTEKGFLLEFKSGESYIKLYDKGIQAKIGNTMRVELKGMKARYFESMKIWNFKDLGTKKTANSLARKINHMLKHLVFSDDTIVASALCLKEQLLYLKMKDGKEWAIHKGIKTQNQRKKERRFKTLIKSRGSRGYYITIPKIIKQKWHLLTNS